MSTEDEVATPWEATPAVATGLYHAATDGPVPLRIGWYDPAAGLERTAEIAAFVREGALMVVNPGEEPVPFPGEACITRIGTNTTPTAQLLQTLFQQGFETEGVATSRAWSSRSTHLAAYLRRILQMGQALASATVESLNAVWAEVAAVRADNLAALGAFHAQLLAARDWSATTDSRLGAVEQVLPQLHSQHSAVGATATAAHHVSQQAAQTAQTAGQTAVAADARAEEAQGAATQARGTAEVAHQSAMAADATAQQAQGIAHEAHGVATVADQKADAAGQEAMRAFGGAQEAFNAATSASTTADSATRLAEAARQSSTEALQAVQALESQLRTVRDSGDSLRADLRSMMSAIQAMRDESQKSAVDILAQMTAGREAEEKARHDAVKEARQEAAREAREAREAQAQELLELRREFASLRTAFSELQTAQVPRPSPENPTAPPRGDTPPAPPEGPPRETRDGAAPVYDVPSGSSESRTLEDGTLASATADGDRRHASFSEAEWEWANDDRPFAISDYGTWYPFYHRYGMPIFMSSFERDLTHPVKDGRCNDPKWVDAYQNAVGLIELLLPSGPLVEPNGRLNKRGEMIDRAMVKYGAALAAYRGFFPGGSSYERHVHFTGDDRYLLQRTEEVLQTEFRPAARARGTRGQRATGGGGGRPQRSQGGGRQGGSANAGGQRAAPLVIADRTAHGARTPRTGSREFRPPSTRGRGGKNALRGPAQM